MEVVTHDELVDAIEGLKAALMDGLAEVAEKAGNEQVHFTRDEAADYLRISTASLDRRATDGDIKRAKLGGGTVIYRRCDLDACIEANLEADKRDAQRFARGSFDY